MMIFEAAHCNGSTKDRGLNGHFQVHSMEWCTRPFSKLVNVLLCKAPEGRVLFNHGAVTADSNVAGVSGRKTFRLVTQRPQSVDTGCKVSSGTVRDQLTHLADVVEIGISGGCGERVVSLEDSTRLC